MKRTLLAAALLAATATTALAEPQFNLLYERGDWSVAYGLSTAGRPTCSLAVTGKDRSLFIKYFGDKQLWVHIFKDGWVFPENVEVPLTFTFDQYPPAPATGRGHVGTARWSFVEFGINPNFVKEFFERLENGSRLLVNFSAGNERPWQIDLIGSGAAMASFHDCIVKVWPPSTSSTPQPTQPYAQSKPTQPYGNAAPTQPYGPKTVPTVPVRRPRDDGGI